MAWTIEYAPAAERALKKLDIQTAQRIRNYMQQNVATAEKPRQIGKPLTGNKGGLWRYRVGDYRVVCDIQDGKIRILVLDVGHRREVYRNK